MMEMNPIKMLTDTLAEMTARAMEAEKALEEERGRAEAWYKACIEARDKCATLEAKLDAATELREQAHQALKEEKDLHMETWGKCKELMEIAVRAGVHKESLEKMIYGEGGPEDAE